MKLRPLVFCLAACIALVAAPLRAADATVPSTAEVAPPVEAPFSLDGIWAFTVDPALAAVPRGIREASLALGASKWQTIRGVVLPAAAPGVLTGVILAMARGAGEVAPLMMVGVVKLAPSLPLDGVFPFLHADRKFMHLGFHIFDIGFQSPDSDAARPMVFATTLLLILVVIVLNLGAILLRNHLRNKYKTGAF